MLDVEREGQFLQTMIVAKAATIDRTSESEIKVYNDLLSDYRSVMFDLGRQEAVESKDKKIMESDLARLMGKRKKEVVLTAEAGDRINQEMESISIRDVKDTVK